MITVPAFPDLLKPGAPVVVSPDSPMIDEHPSVVVAVIRRLGVPDAFRVAGSSTGVWSGKQLALILDDPDRIGQTLALGWLARRLGVVMPEVGSPQWRRVIDMRTSERVIGYAVGPDPFVIDPHSGVAGRAGWLAEGPRLALFTARLDRVGLETLCPALDNPDAADAPIRALALAVEIVANAEQSRAR